MCSVKSFLTLEEGVTGENECREEVFIDLEKGIKTII